MLIFPTRVVLVPVYSLSLWWCTACTKGNGSYLIWTTSTSDSLDANSLYFYFSYLSSFFWYFFSYFSLTSFSLSCIGRMLSSGTSSVFFTSESRNLSLALIICSWFSTRLRAQSFPSSISYLFFRRYCFSIPLIYFFSLSWMYSMYRSFSAFCFCLK